MNRPIKKAMMEQWEDSMLEGEGIEAGVAKTLTRKLVTEWVIGAYSSISEEMGCTAWRKKGFEWMVNEVLL